MGNGLGTNQSIDLSIAPLDPYPSYSGGLLPPNHIGFDNTSLNSGLAQGSFLAAQGGYRTGGGILKNVDSFANSSIFPSSANLTRATST